MQVGPMPPSLVSEVVTAKEALVTCLPSKLSRCYIFYLYTIV